MRKPHNFFKHSDKDAGTTVKFFPDSNYLMLLMAYQYFFRLTQIELVEGRVLQMWFFLKYPDRAPEDWKPHLNKLSRTVTHKDFDVFLDLINTHRD
jgi:hypothetical protein